MDGPLCFVSAFDAGIGFLFLTACVYKMMATSGRPKCRQSEDFIP